MTKTTTQTFASPGAAVVTPPPPPPPKDRGRYSFVESRGRY